jgi:hypothetical protein
MCHRADPHLTYLRPWLLSKPCVSHSVTEHDIHPVRRGGGCCNMKHILSAGVGAVVSRGGGGCSAAQS